MPIPKLQHVLAKICNKLSKADIPHALIGAMALALYGIPRYTADIDLLSDSLHTAKLKAAMGKLGYQCYHQTETFVQFESADKISGEVDFLLVHTDEGRAILERSVLVQDELMGSVPVVQPTDYAVLKLMAIANNKDRKTQDSADLALLFKADTVGLTSRAFASLDFQFIERFAKQFRSLGLLNSLRS